jgi:DNA-binding MarR family transcriptional regulator
MSETILGLVRRGLVARFRAHDKRTFDVELTPRGRNALENAYRMTRALLKRTLAKLFRSEDSLMEMHDEIGRHVCARRVLGDESVRELVWLWHPDN